MRANARHPFRTIDTEGNEAWTRVSALQPGNRVVSVELAGAQDCSATTATSSSDTGLPSDGFWLLSNTYGRGVDTVASVEPTGYAEVFDIEVEGTHNFIANGLEVSNTRWHDDDLAGRLLRYSAQPWEVLNIPAQCVDPRTDPLGRAEGEFMVSARGRDLRDWQVRKAEAGERMWWALFQGDPRPDTGDILKRGWWKHYQQLPLIVDEHGRHWLTGFDEVVQSWDYTFDEGAKADYVVGQVWARRGSAIYLVDQVRDRMGYPEQTAATIALRNKWPQTGPVLIEKKANGAAVISTISQSVPGIIPIIPTESKPVRAKAISPFVQAGNCNIPDPRLPENAWVAGFIEECAAFPTGVNDDQVDTFTQAAAWFYQPALREQAERAARELTGSDRVYDLG